jgi:cell division protein FtsQ
MNTATIRRNSGRGTRGGISGGGAKRPSKRKGLVARLAGKLPFDENQLHRLTTWVLGLVLIAMLWLAAVFFGVPAMIWSEVSDVAKHAGLQVAKVEVHGTEHMDELPVYNQAIKQVDHSMIDLDLVGLRAEIMKLGWVEDARVSRRLPDTLVVDIVERRPVAIWQHDGKLNLIDAQGVMLNGVEPRSMPHLPLVVGPDANHQTAALGKLLGAAPALKPMLAGATWVGNRRWDLLFDTGETLSLPEGTDEAAKALRLFAERDGTLRLLGRGWLKFDMRNPDRMVMRKPDGSSRIGVPTSSQGNAPASTDSAASRDQV